MDIMTQRVPLANIGGKIAEKYGEGELVRKFIGGSAESADVQFDEGERSVISYITTLSVDRDDEVVLPRGADLNDYRKNPVVLWAHKYDMLPVGKEIWIKNDERGLITKTVYAKHEEADRIFNYRKEGFPLGRSIGFIPLEWVDKGAKEYDAVMKDWQDAHEKAFGARPEKEPRRIYTKWTMLENSDCPIPSNPDAIQIAVAKGLMQPDEAEDWVLDLEDVPMSKDVDTDVADMEEPTDDQEAIVDEKEPAVEGTDIEQEDGPIDELDEKQVVQDDVEQKSGRVLSAKNRATIQSAIDALGAVLKADQPDEDEEPEEDEKAVDEIVIEIDEQEEITHKDVEDMIVRHLDAIDISAKMQKTVELALAKLMGKASI